MLKLTKSLNGYNTDEIYCPEKKRKENFVAVSSPSPKQSFAALLCSQYHTGMFMRRRRDKHIVLRLHAEGESSFSRSLTCGGTLFPKKRKIKILHFQGNRGPFYILCVKSGRIYKSNNVDIRLVKSKAKSSSLDDGDTLAKPSQARCSQLVYPSSTL